MTLFHQNVGLTEASPSINWINNGSMYVRFGGMRNTKTWSKSYDTGNGVVSYFFCSRMF